MYLAETTGKFVSRKSVELGTGHFILDEHTGELVEIDEKKKKITTRKKVYLVVIFINKLKYIAIKKSETSIRNREFDSRFDIRREYTSLCVFIRASTFVFILPT